MHLALLLATLAALLSGPLIYAVAHRRPSLLAFLDGFVLVSIAGLVLLEVVPGAFVDGGLWSGAFLLLGLLGPTFFEHLLSRARRSAHIAALALAILGLVLHSMADGAALSPLGHESLHRHEALALAVAIHSVPVGLVVWWLMAPVFGPLLPALAIAAMCAGTLVGYRYGIELNEILGLQAWAWFQALVAGSILHVVFGRPHLDDHAAEQTGPPPWEGLGNLAAMAALLLIGGTHAGEGLDSGFAQRFLALALESAPALLLAYVIGGFISGELPDSWLRWLSRGGAGSQALRGMAVGLPLPICSCGVLPLYESLIRRGVPLAAATAFLIATPEVGLTALFVSLPLLGLEATLLRVGAAALLATFVGWALARWLAVPRMTPVPAASCGACCGHEHAPAAPQPRLKRALRSGLVELVDDTAAWIVAGIALAAFAMPYAEGVLWTQLPDALEVLVFALVGMPLYVCSAAATPLVAVLIAAGVSPGAAIAFLLTGPATNIATFGVLAKLHDRRHALAFAVVTAAGAVTIGVVVNLFLPSLQIAIPDAHAHAGSLIQQLSLLLLALLYAASLLRRGGRGWMADIVETSRP
ncbi:MAG TPA: permease [Solimonas sp.]|nr:permease [Solimonas sp.]